MALRLIGLFRIDEPIGTQAYRIHLPAHFRIHNVFHVSVLEPYHTRPGDQEVLPPPKLVEEEEEYEVEEVTAKRLRQGSYWYKVKWKGWPEEYDQWVYEDSMTYAKDMIRAFEKKPRRRRNARSGIAYNRKQDSGDHEE
jgi:hypothetical protein